MRWLLLLTLLAVIGGCAPRPKPVWEALPTANRLLAELEDLQGRYQSLDAAAKVSLTLPESYFSSRQFLALQRPNRLRADILTGFGQLVMQLATDGESLQVFRHDSVPGRFYRGPASPDNLARFLRLPLRAEDLLRLLLYAPPLQEFDESRVTSCDQGLQMTLRGDSGRQDVVFDRQLRLITSHYFVGDSLQLAVTYDDFSGPEMFPGEILLDWPGAGIRARLALSDLRLNPPLTVERFRLDPPEGIPAEPLPPADNE